MAQFTTRAIIVLVVLVLSGCNGSSGPTAHTLPGEREAVPTLNEQDARERSARVGKVAYDLDFELDGEQDEFSGQVAISFELSDASRNLTLDFVGGTVTQVHVNGHTIDVPYNGYFLSLPANALREGSNGVQIAFSHRYSADGSGLYRFRDPIDGRDYLYTNFEPYDANRLFPCFDQPDLKATYATRVTVPADWQVISIVDESEVTDLGDSRRWSFPKSVRISTYIYALHAGGYQRWESTAGDIPLRLFARVSVAEYVYPEDWFLPTRQGFEFFEGYFDIPYPFAKYDQVIVPHFNPGAMENVGAVTFNERFLQRGTVTRQARRSLASVILHEMAHMWFGNLVTMDWWNGLWLNESFATFMATLAMGEATEFTEAGLMAYRSSIRAYRADERDTTHPIEMPTLDTDTAFANFDAITYSKGSATLTQLNHLVGPEVFRLGVSAYLKSHAYGNTTIDDFLGAIAKAADMDLEDWSADWLQQPGTNFVEVEFSCRNDRIEDLSIVQATPDEWPTLRTHRTQLGFYNFDRDDGVEIRVLPVTYAGARTDVPAPEIRCPEFVYANHGDWDYARVDFDREELSVLRDHLNKFDDPLIRSMLWQGIYNMVDYLRLSPGDFIDIALANVHREPDDDLARQVLGGLQNSWSYLRRLEDDEEYLVKLSDKIESFMWGAFLNSEPGSDRQLLWFDNFRGSVTSASGLDRLASMLLAELQLPDGFVFDQDRRWGVLQKLSGYAHPNTEELLVVEQARDPSDKGRRRSLSVEAARPDREQQRRLVAMLLESSEDLSVADARSYSGGLFPLHQHDLQLEIVGEVLDRLQDVSDRVDPRYFGSITGGPLGTICDQSYLDQLEHAVAQSATLHPSLRKRLLNMRFDVRRCLEVGEALSAENP